MASESQLTTVPISELRPLLTGEVFDKMRLDDGLRGELESLRMELGVASSISPTSPTNEIAESSEENERDIPTALTVSHRFARILKDMRDLPLGEGDARPSDRSLEMVASLAGSYTYTRIGTGLFDRMQQSGMTAFADYYNGFKVHHPERAEFFWDCVKKDPQFRMVLNFVARILVTSISVGESEDEKFNLAMEDIQKFFSNDPVQYIHAKTPAMILLLRMKNDALQAFTTLLLSKVTSRQIPLLASGEHLEDPELFRDSLHVSQIFQAMDRGAHLDMLANPLGQAQTANPTQAESYFRARESVPELKLQNNFGYVYLSKKQTVILGISAESSGVTSFTYFNEPYCAVPVGLYFARKFLDLFLQSVDYLYSLAQAFEGTPAGNYYRALAAYYMAPINAPDGPYVEPGGDGVVHEGNFIQDYHELCYAAERAWVRYVRYAEEKKLPFIHIHPFERYATASTKSHDLSLAIVNPQETTIFLEGKQRFRGNVRKFLEQTGVAARYPDMTEKTDVLIGSAATISLGARVFSALVGTLAQNVPDEEAGKKDGVASLFDTAFARVAVPSTRGQITRKSDPIGIISAKFDSDASDPEKFIRHYVGVVLSHELGHNLHRGQKGSFQSDGKGLSINLIEEGKATSNIALYYENPYSLSDADLEHLRSSILLLVTWSMVRLRPKSRVEYQADQYFREGGVMIDAMLKSGLLEIVGVVLGERGEFTRVDSERLDVVDFEFLRFNFSDDALRNFIKRCADFLVQLAEPYYETQFRPDASPDRVVPDITTLDFWQALLLTCIDEDIARRSAKNSTPRAEIEALAARKDALHLPGNPAMFPVVRALIRYSDFESMKRFRATVARKHGLSLDDPSLEEHIKAAQGEIEAQFPAIRYS